MSDHELDVHGERTEHTAMDVHCALVTNHVPGCDCGRCASVRIEERQRLTVRVVIDALPISGGVDDLMAAMAEVDGVDVALVSERLWSQPWRAVDGEEIESLTRREVRVAELVCAGVSRCDVARMMGMSPKTFDSHRGKVMRKLRVANEVQLLRLAVLRGWVEL